MAGYSSASWAIGVLFSDCITKDTPPPFDLPSTTFGYTPGNADSILSSMENLYAKYLQDGGLPIILSDVPKPGAPWVAGEISAVTKQIMIYPGGNWGTIAEELLHYVQLKKYGYWRKGENPIQVVVDAMENQIGPILARWGFVPS